MTTLLSQSDMFGANLRGLMSEFRVSILFCYALDWKQEVQGLGEREDDDGSAAWPGAIPGTFVAGKEATLLSSCLASLIHEEAKAFA